MGTRSLTHIKKAGRDSETLTTIYRQFDGYLEGHGADIKKALGGKTVVNGYSDPDKQVNGMGCAAAMLIAGIKAGIGDVYIHTPDTSDVWEEYTYTLWGEEGGEVQVSVTGYDGEIYSGPLSGLPEHEPEEEDA